MEQTFWKNRYSSKQTGWDIGDVSTPIKAYLDQLDDKNVKILFPGCGFGYEAIYAHRLGFKNVYVLDFVEEALIQLKLNCPSFPSANILVTDFFKLEETFDLVIEQTLFCAIDPSRRSEYAKQALKILKPKGKIVGLLFNRTFDSGPPFGGSVAEYESTFSPYFKEIKIAPCYNSIPSRAGTEVFFQLMR